MRSLRLLAGLTALAVSSVASPVKRAGSLTSYPYQITNLLISDINTDNTTLSFTLHDPQPLSNSTAACSASWQHGSSDYPQGDYTMCGNTTLGWNIASWTSVRNFALDLESSFDDPAYASPAMKSDSSLTVHPSVGSYPYGGVTTFAQVNINSTNVDYATTSSGTFGTQIANTTISAPIYALIA